ncbi:MAG: N-6 DNA methylase [Chloroflexi bacterium]|nr:N-6 DNA methylase [Chloroflexota bacterium]
MFDTNKKPAGDQKRRGGYYTPLKLASFLAKWAVRGGKQRILEPSSGDGNFVVACLEQSQNSHKNLLEPKIEIVAVEIEKEEIQKGKARVQALVNGHFRVEWLAGDFLSLFEALKKAGLFDAVLGNPPFIRFQYFDDKSREVAFTHLRSADYHPTKLANAWAAFVELSIELLADGGRLAMVVPAELLQVKYAAELRSRLSKHFEHIVLIGFRPKFRAKFAVSTVEKSGVHRPNFARRIGHAHLRF